MQEQEQDPTNLYIANLPTYMTESQLETMLTPYGKVVSTRILRDMHQQPRGVGFARMESRAVCEVIISTFNNQLLPGCKEPLLVKFADGGSKKKPPFKGTGGLSIDSRNSGSNMNSGWRDGGAISATADAGPDQLAVAAAAAYGYGAPGSASLDHHSHHHGHHHHHHHTNAAMMAAAVAHHNASQSAHHQAAAAHTGGSLTSSGTAPGSLMPIPASALAAAGYHHHPHPHHPHPHHSAAAAAHARNSASAYGATAQQVANNSYPALSAAAAAAAAAAAQAAPWIHHHASPAAAAAAAAAANAAAAVAHYPMLPPGAAAGHMATGPGQMTMQQGPPPQVDGTGSGNGNNAALHFMPALAAQMQQLQLSGHSVSFLITRKL